LLVRRLVCCGGLAVRNPLLMQIMADVTGHVLPVVESCEAAARGAALWATVARGRYADIDAATAALPVRIARTYEPRNTQNYDSLYALYCRLHDHFGRHDELLHDLGKLQRQARAAGD
jgi:L-ribulokinase